MDTIETMRSFIHAVDAGSFAAAGRRLGYSRALVSKYVGALEARLKVTLLNRTTRTLSLTEIGESYYQRATSILSELDDLEHVTQGAELEPKGTLRISSPRCLGQNVIAPSLPDFFLIYPEIDIELICMDRAVNLGEEGIDLAFLLVKDVPPPSLISRKLDDYPVVLCASPKYLKIAPDLKTAEDLHHHICIVNDDFLEGSNWRLQEKRDNAVITTNVTVRGNVHVNDNEAVRQIAMKNIGLALLPYHLVKSNMEEGRLVQVADIEAAYNLSIYLAHSAKSPVNERKRAFINFCVKIFFDR